MKTTVGPFSYNCFPTFILFFLLNFSKGDDDIYHNQFAAHIPGGDLVADKVASRVGLINLGKIGDLQDHYLLQDYMIHKRSLSPAHSHHTKLMEEKEVIWFMQQKELNRFKRGGRKDYTEIQDFSHIPDPMFRNQWFINHGARDGSDMNVVPAWKLGYTGKGVVVTILDDGIQYNHPDLERNYDPLASKDINDNDDDPMPQDNGDNKHGTRCAGEVAAEAFNKHCGVGVAYNAGIGGVRMLDGMVNDAVEAKSLSLNPAHIDIYSASWGPEDDGKTVDGPGPLAKKAFINGVSKGRAGLGSIFVWASGNGGHHTDNCNCDGYTNSIYTLSISSATQGGFKPWYLEECSSTLATTYSSGTPGQDASITTVDQDARLRPDHLCTSSHTGTSASAPLAAGIVALALEANRNLTWRDMQHLVVLTSNPSPLQHEKGWLRNSVQRAYSHKFGYGLLDAAELVKLAVKWDTAPTQHICETRVEAVNKLLSRNPNMKVNVSIITDGCDNMLNKVRYLEHIQARISLKYFPRGKLKIVLVSPRGTRSYLLLPRPKDRIASSFEDWPFLSVHFWGEDPTGEWRLELSNSDGPAVKMDGVLKHWQLVLYGTEFNPLGGVAPDKPGSLIDKSEQINIYDGAPNISTTPSLTPVQGCHEQCSRGCTGPNADECNDCKNFFYEGRCVNICPLGTYSSISRDDNGELEVLLRQNQCRPCHMSCHSCWGPGIDNCLTCGSGQKLLSNKGRCVPYCPVGYSDENTVTCEKCDINCKKCLKNKNITVCSSCRTNYALYKGLCVSQCPPDHFQTSTNGQEGSICHPCHSSCSTCIGPLDTQCGLCKEDSFYFERRCVPYCPAGYNSDLVRRECVSCPMGCDDCSGGVGVCKACRTEWELTPSGQCLPPQSKQCQPGMYAGRGTCLACHNSCNTCLGPKHTDCTSCYPDHKMHISSCAETCPSGSKPSPEVNTCIACPHACSTCNTSGCISCHPNYHLLPNLATCATHCKQGEFSDSESVCKKCHFSCLECYGPGSNQCSVCHDSSQSLLSDGQCTDTCPNGSFQASTSVCNHCHSSCSACSGQGPGNCTACSMSNVLINGFCISCEEGFFLSSETGHCTPCHFSCQSCSGPDSNQCISCAGQLQLDSWSSICVPCCSSLDTSSDSSSLCCPCGPGHGLCISPTRSVRSPSLLNSLRGRTSTIVMSLGLALGLFVAILYMIVTVSRQGNSYSVVSNKEEKTLLTRHEPDSDNGDISDSEESDFLVINKNENRRDKSFKLTVT